MPSPRAAIGHIESALQEEREMVLTLGGFAIELAGGVLVFNERLPVPRFNFVQYIRLHRNRQAAFLEKALDHYFQRALRPSIRVEQPVPEFLEASLHNLGFRPTAGCKSLLFRRRVPRSGPKEQRFEVRPATPEELPMVTGFWTATAEQEEFLRALVVAVEHPNPDERIVPVIAFRGGRPASAALLHVYRSHAGIHAVATQPSERGQGAATALVLGVVNGPLVPASAAPVAMWSDSPRLDQHLTGLGFDVAVRYAVYELPPGAELTLPPAPPTGPPRWRPPRRATGAS